MTQVQKLLQSGETSVVVPVPWGSGRHVTVLSMSGLPVHEPWSWRESQEGDTEVFFPDLKPGHPPWRVMVRSV